MKTNFTGKLVGQTEEGIEKVEWLNPRQVREALANSYQNIQLLFE
jgi:uncharacterized protein with HEPN domain